VSEHEDPRLRLTHDSSDGAVVVQLRGELDVWSSPMLEDYVGNLRPLGTPLKLDVSGVEFIDSSGIRVLTATRQAAIDDVGVPVILVGCTDMLRKLLRITGLATAFEGVDG